MRAVTVILMIVGFGVVSIVVRHMKVTTTELVVAAVIAVAATAYATWLTYRRAVSRQTRK